MVGMVEDTLHELIIERLARTELPEPAAALVLAGLGAGAESDREAAEPPARTYLRSLTVEGFRGIGRRQVLKLPPGPGLILIVGRNGSGKSSFAEALEFALTGDSLRWKGRPTVWRDGWRNLHSPDPCRISVGLAVDGRAGSTTLVRSWAPDADLQDATTQEPAGGLGWAAPLELYRPFLAYSELGSLINAKPTELHDSIQRLLGLDRLVDLDAYLKDVRKRAQDQLDRSTDELTKLRALVRRTDDPRAGHAADLLAADEVDLVELGKLAAGETEPAAPLRRLRQLAGLAIPAESDVRQKVDELRLATEAVRAMAGGSADTARKRATLLAAALDHHAQHGDGPCPVCGEGRLDMDWQRDTAAEIERLRAEAKAIDTAHEGLAVARRGLRTLLTAAPTGLDQDAAELVEVWTRWAEPPDTGDDGLAEHVLGTYGELAAAVAKVRAEADRQLATADESWRPLARRLAGWVELATTARAAEPRLHAAREALDWLRAQGQALRDERLAPFAARSRAIWQRLRQQSNVEIGALRLDGAGSRRQLRLDVAVDDVDAAGLGVMSQGELHALGLALFLPRATTPESPFRFVVIDDPVQAMDPAKVDGLAKVLLDAAATHQVIVFSHDDRLPEALRRLQLPATMWEVVRREESELELRKAGNPIQLYLDDARAIAKTKQLTYATRGPVVAGMCRSAIEAACHAAIRRRQLDRGVPHAEIEERIAKASTLGQIAALCLFDDGSRSSDVPRKLSSEFGVRAFTAFRQCDQATHGRVPVEDPMGLITAVTRLVKRIEVL